MVLPVGMLAFLRRIKKKVAIKKSKYVPTQFKRDKFQLSLKYNYIKISAFMQNKFLVRFFSSIKTKQHDFHIHRTD